MFWQLLFAHLIADYPLQTNWIAGAKGRMRGLLVHILVHILVLLAIAGAALPLVWPHLLTLALLHLVIDFCKAQVTRRKPAWVIVPYLVDQALHILVLVGIAFWIAAQVGDVAALLPIDRTVAIYGSGYVLTYVWFISERIMAHSNPSYQEEINREFWPRQIARMLFLTLLLLVSHSALALLVSHSVVWPYRSSRYRLREVLSDVVVVVAIWGCIHLALLC